MEFHYISFHINASSEIPDTTCGQTENITKINGHVRESEHVPEKEGEEQGKDE